ncbi:MAG: hypothetical protein OEM26_14260, partial [Saprospiraceae bacterium]|nr:hypothetical protein [Saprospiraceae bacterium]
MTYPIKATLRVLFLLFPVLVSGADYFWVGGSGDWSDLSHWATSSGGTVQHDQVPSASDNVIFDANSFSATNQTVVLNLDIVFAGNVDFSGINQGIRLQGSSNTTMAIHGSLTMHPNVTLDFPGNFDFKSSVQGNEIHWYGQQPKQLNFLGTGQYIWKTNVVVDSLIHVEFGQLVFEEINVSCRRFEVFSTSGVAVDFGTVNLLVRGNRVREMQTYRWRESLHFEGQGITTIPGMANIRLNGIRASVGFHNNNETIRLPNVVLGANNGQHLVFASWVGDHQFGRLHLLGDTRFEGHFTFANLELDGGNVYAFQSNSNQRIGNLISNSDCSQTSLIRTLESGVPATFQAQNGAQSLSFVVLQDIQISGATYEANQAIDLGGNSGWNITDKNLETFYWVGGTGNWNDTDHWSFSSGGASSGCLPTAADDVIFDANSFNAAGQTVTINVPTAFCHSMDWRGVNRACRLVDMKLENRTSILIFGSLWFSEQLTNDFGGDVYFVSSHDGNEILIAGSELNQNVYFNSASGEWTLQDKLDVNDSLHFNAGTLHTNDYEIECFQFFSRTSSRRNLHLGNTTFRIVHSTTQTYHGSQFEVWADNFTIFPGR